MDLSIVIVNYNTKELLMQCIESIYAAKGDLGCEIIVVDNNSNDGSVRLIKENFPFVKLFTNRENIGFSKANNQGFRVAQAELIMFLNPDTVVRNGALERIIDFMKMHQNVGILAPKLIYPDGSLQLSCRSFYNIRTILLRRTLLGRIFHGSELLKKHVMSESSHEEIQEIDWALGACLVVPSHVFKKVGGFDEGYKMYFEDVDLCYRVKKAGYKECYFPQAVVVHHHQRESAGGFSQKTLWHIQSGIRFFNKHGWQF